MIPIGNLDGPQIRFGEGRFGEEQRRLVVHDSWGYVCVEKWTKLCAYSEPWDGGVDMSKLLHHAVEDLVKKRLALEPNSSTVWEFNVLAPNMQDFIRMVAFFDRPHLRRWSWWERRVVAPLYRYVARVYNFVLG
jgi:hypothetical protein